MRKIVLKALKVRHPELVRGTDEVFELLEDAITLCLEMTGVTTEKAPSDEEGYEANQKRFFYHRVNQLLEEWGFESDLLGTQLLKVLVPHMAMSPEGKYLYASKEMYPWVGKFFNMKQSAVEHNIRSAMEKALRKVSDQKVRDTFGKKPSTRKFIKWLEATLRREWAAKNEE